MRAARILRAVCLAGIAVGIAVALLTSASSADAEPLPVTVTTTTMAPTGDLRDAVGLTGPIGASVEGTRAVGTVATWRLPGLPGLGLPDVDWGRAVLGAAAIACLFVVAIVRI